MRKVIPLGNRLLVKRKRVGEKVGEAGLIYMPDEIKDKPTDLATVAHIPEHSFADMELIDNAEEIVKALTVEAKKGSADALKALIDFNNFLKIKSIQPGDLVMISKYVGSDFHSTEDHEMMTLVYDHDVMAIIKGERKDVACQEKRSLSSRI